MATMTRKDYAAMYGPTTGDLVRLGDTSLLVEVERDYAVYGEECVIGGGKTLRDGMGIDAGHRLADGAIDMVIVNVLVIDDAGIVKGDIGIKGGKIVAIGKAGNPHIMAGVDPRLIVGPNTQILHRPRVMIATVGGFDVHVHFVGTDQCAHALSSGITTMLGGALGPAFDVDCGGPWTTEQMLRAAEGFAMNFGFFARGSSHKPEAIVEQVRRRRHRREDPRGFRRHRRPSIDASLGGGRCNDFAVHAAHRHDQRVRLLREHDGHRRPHHPHVSHRGCGRRACARPDPLQRRAQLSCPPRPIRPTPSRPTGSTRRADDDDGALPELRDSRGRRLRRERVRPQTMAAEDMLHDMGAISIFGTDSQGMGRSPRTSRKCWQLASVMKDQRSVVCRRKRQRAPTTSASSATSPSTPSIPPAPRHRPLCRQHGARQDGGPRPLARRPSSASSRGRAEGRPSRLGRPWATAPAAS